MQAQSNAPTIDPVGLLATEVLRDLYRAVCGQEPTAVRAYQDDDALLLLLRFDPTEFEARAADGLSPLLDTAFLAVPGMVASAVEARTGRRIAPGNLSVSADRGLAVFAFLVLEETAALESDEDPFRIDAGLGARSADHARLRLVS